MCSLPVGVVGTEELPAEEGEGAIALSVWKLLDLRGMTGIAVRKTETKTVI